MVVLFVAGAGDRSGFTSMRRFRGRCSALDMVVVFGARSDFVGGAMNRDLWTRGMLVLSLMCKSRMCELICAHSYLWSHVFPLMCAFRLSYLCFQMRCLVLCCHVMHIRQVCAVTCVFLFVCSHICALICVFSCVCSHVLSYVCSLMCASIWLPWFSEHCLGPLARIVVPSSFGFLDRRI